MAGSASASPSARPPTAITRIRHTRPTATMAATIPTTAATTPTTVARLWTLNLAADKDDHPELAPLRRGFFLSGGEQGAARHPGVLLLA
jgi:hypothetical protein